MKKDTVHFQPEYETPNLVGERKGKPYNVHKGQPESENDNR